MLWVNWRDRLLPLLSVFFVFLLGVRGWHALLIQRPASAPRLEPAAGPPGLRRRGRVLFFMVFIGGLVVFVLLLS